MMIGEIHLQDTVALAHDLPAHGLKRGRIGTVIEVLDNDLFEVEFCDEDGNYELAALRSAQLIALRRELISVH